MTELERYIPRVASYVVDVFYSDGHKAGESRLVSCPFCLLQHAHGNVLGTRNAHCATTIPKRLQKVDPRDACNNPGYDLRDPSEDIDWGRERLVAQLLVLRNKGRRLTAEHADMDPWTAREKRVKANLKTEIDAIAAMLRLAGVEL